MTRLPDPADDIQQALDTVQHRDAGVAGASSLLPTEGSGDVLAHAHNRAWLDTLHFALMRCGIMAERYPWQATALLMVAIGCGTLCNYFGWTILGAMAWYAAASED